MASSLFVSDPAYSLQSNQFVFLCLIENVFSNSYFSKYPIGRTTVNLKVPYYVKENFASEFQGSVKRLEMSVEEDYVSNLRHSCFREKNYREFLNIKHR